MFEHTPIRSHLIPHFPAHMRTFICRRRLATISDAGSKSHQFQTFDRAAKLLHRKRNTKYDIDLSRRKDYLRDEVANKTIERLAFITRDISKVLDFGSGLGSFLKSLCTPSLVHKEADETERLMINQINEDKKTITSKIKDLVMVDSSEAMLMRDAGEEFISKFPGTVSRYVADEEKFDHACLAEPNSYDAVVSNLSLHWINDLPATLQNINRILKPDGLFMGTLIGGDTLYELRTSLQLAEVERMGGMSPRVSPLVHLNDIGNLLNRADFSMLTIDAEDIVVGGFPDIAAVCEDLQIMGEQNAVLSRPEYLPRDVLLAANEIYKSLHGETDPEGNISLPVTFNVIFMIGWKKSDTQPKPLKRGSGTINLKDVL